MTRRARKWTLWILPRLSYMKWDFCGLMCVINFVNLRPMEQALTRVEAQIRPYIRECWRVDLFQSPLIALSNSLSFACAHCPLSFSSLCICWSPCTVQKRALFVLVLAAKQKQRDGYGWEWPDSASLFGLCPNTETRHSCPPVFRENLPLSFSSHSD